MPSFVYFNEKYFEKILNKNISKIKKKQKNYYLLASF